ncbi:preprotein translocase subunit YajC [Pseudoflavonifractor phocaeensis]|uniref:preprotein translocase subunit YajC n=1 Tax=Pseudoflavonifractor phocaeensis TaxID=1870988 RepID=UPI002FF69C5C
MTAQLATTLLSGTGTDTGSGTIGLLGTFLPLILLVVVFYFLLIRPENKKKKAAAQMRSALAVGDQITTIGGVVGTVCAVKEETIVIETSSDRVRMEFTKWAVSSRGTQTTQDGPGETKDAKDKK